MTGGAGFVGGRADPEARRGRCPGDRPRRPVHRAGRRRSRPGPSSCRARSPTPPSSTSSSRDQPRPPPRRAQHHRLDGEPAGRLRDEHRGHAQRPAGRPRQQGRPGRVHVVGIGLRQPALDPDQRGRRRRRRSRRTPSASSAARTTARPSTRATACRPRRSATRNVYGPGQRPDNPYCGVVSKFLVDAHAGRRCRSTATASRPATTRISTTPSRRRSWRRSTRAPRARSSTSARGSRRRSTSSAARSAEPSTSRSSSATSTAATSTTSGAGSSTSRRPAGCSAGPRSGPSRGLGETAAWYKASSFSDDQRVRQETGN